jgi:hypothetical protein
MTGESGAGASTSTTAAFPRDPWLEEWEKQAIIAFHLQNPQEGYRRLTFMMLDANIVAASPTPLCVPALTDCKWCEKSLPAV